MDVRGESCWIWREIACHLTSVLLHMQTVKVDREPLGAGNRSRTFARRVAPL
jgi:hypothetical protein